MKAVCALLCLVLAHGVTANIFKPLEKVAELDVQDLYIDQNQRQLDQTLESSKQWQQQQHSHQTHQHHGHQRHQPKQRDQTVYSQFSESQQYELPQYRRDQSGHSSEEQYGQTQSKWKRSHHQKMSHKTVSSESSQDSSEKKNMNYMKSAEQQYTYNQPQQYAYQPDLYFQRQQQSQEQSSQDQPQQWNPLYDSTMKKVNQIASTYGDVTYMLQKQMGKPTVQVQNQEEIEKIFGEAKKSMKHITKEEQVAFHEAYELSKQQNHEDAELNATQLAQKYQYPIEEHIVKTDDGYVLTLFRIPPKTAIRDVQKRPVVFLMHGILGSADDWLLMGPGKSLAYLLSDAGYDVWLGNARGNKYSMKHVSKHPAVPDFWQYSSDEIALHDLPTMIDYALETTKQEKLYYIGHSQGTTNFFALTAARPEYNDKIIMMYALSPMVYMTNVRSPLLRMIAPTSQYYQQLVKNFGNGAFNPSKELIKVVGGDMLENETGCKKVSSHINFVMSGVNVADMNVDLIQVVRKHLPAGTSTKVIKQYGQNVASQDFRRYDYGPQINEKIYGKQQPPKYEMEKVQAPVTLFYSEEDWLAHPQDVERLEKELPNVKESYKVPEQHFSNMDFQFSTKAPEMVYQKIIESMQKQQISQ